jgi:RNA polymerase sigma-70 factor, ECF subfamily
VPVAATIPASSLSGIRAVPPGPANDASSFDVANLSRRLAASDEAAFREFHALYFDRLYHFLLVVTRGDEHAARDALQETLLRVVRYARAFDHEEIFWGWLKAVARSAARDGGRKQRRYRALLERFSLRLGGPPADAGAKAEENLHTLLESGLGELEPEERRLVEGKYLRGATIFELADETGLTEKAVESRLLRVRRQLSAALLRKLQSS